MSATLAPTHETCAALSADIYLLCDNTGSMGNLIETVRKDATRLMSHFKSEGLDIRCGVASYRDVTDGTPFERQITPKANDPAKAFSDVNTAIARWSASGGGDAPEAQLYALYQLADVALEENGWRADAVKVIVWFGDIHGHDPVEFDSLTVTETDVIDRLKAHDVLVIPVSVSSGKGLDTTGQATRIGKSTGLGRAPMATIDPDDVIEGVHHELRNHLPTGVSLYTEEHFQGTEIPLVATDYPNIASAFPTLVTGNDYKSLKVGLGKSLALFESEDFRGMYEVFGPGQCATLPPELRVVSAQVKVAELPVVVTTAFSKEDFLGRGMTFDANTDEWINLGEFDAKILSVKVASGQFVELAEEKNGGGQTQRLTTGEHKLIADALWKKQKRGSKFVKKSKVSSIRVGWV